MKLILLLPALIITQLISAQSVEKIWETKADFLTTESVLFDDTVIYVSNVNGAPTNKDNNGFISRMAPDGSIIQLNWVGNIHAPKGMGVHGKFLYVTNIDEIVVIDRIEGKIVKRLPAENSQFMNDITISDDGVKFASDVLTKTIYTFTNEKCTKWLSAEQLEGVNGLFFGPKPYLYAGTKNNIFAINIDTKEIKEYITNTGSVDGLERVNSHSMLISDWRGKVQLVSTENTAVELLNSTLKNYNAADLEYDEKSKTVYVPTFFGNTVAAYKLTY